MPKNIESYYQEAGRAGRDGQPADCILFYGARDVMTNRFFIEKNDENNMLDDKTRAAVRAKDEQRLRQMTFYCHGDRCLRGYLLRYFGDCAPENCGNCSVCLSKAEKIDITGEARIIFLFMEELAYPLGVVTLCDALRGSESEKVLRHHLEATEGYGRLRATSAKRLRAIFEHLTAAEYLRQSDEYHTLTVSEQAREWLEYGDAITLRFEREEAAAVKSGAANYAAVDPSLFGALKALRLQFAKRASMPAFVIFSDAALRAMCELKPQTMAQFLTVPGVGTKKAASYGEAFLKAIAEHK